MTKKSLVVLVLILGIITLTMCPRNVVNADNLSQDSLKTFLSENSEINARFEYPNYKPTEQSIEKYKIPAHTPIVIKNKNTISSYDIESGECVKFNTVSNIKSKTGGILIRANSPVEATISFKRAKMIGKPGQLTISDFHVTAADGTYIPLSSSVSIKADDSTALSIVLSVLVCPLFLMMKGDEAEIAPGTTKTVYTVDDVYVTPIDPN